MAARQGGSGALTYSPWADAGRRYPDWVIRCVPLEGLSEVLCLDRRVILIDAHARRSSRRTALAHAVAHLDLEHDVLRGVLSDRQELAADKLAAVEHLVADRFDEHE